MTFDHILPPKNQQSWAKSAFDFVKELVMVGLIAVAIIVPVRYFLIQPFYVKGASMEPNFYDHEYLVVNEIGYRFQPPQRGDVVVFKYPKDPSQYFIKRVVGVPGERIVIRDGRVYIGRDAGEPALLEESYLAPDTETDLPVRGYSDVTLGDDEYFLLGDNRPQSLDSRSFGPVRRDFIVGRTWIRGWPFDRMTVFDVPTYNF